MDVNSIFSATRWGSVDTTNNISKITRTQEEQETENTAGAKGNSSPSEEEVTTKITINEKGERVMVFMEGDKVIRSIKLGGGEQMLGDKPMSHEEQQYIDNGRSDIGIMLNLSS